MKAGQGISKSAYAAHRGCAPSAVTRAIKERRITLLPDGTINPRVADVQWAENSRARGDSKSPAAQASPADVAVPTVQPTDDSYAGSRARREKAEAEEAEMRVARMAGRLVERAAVESGVFQVVRMMRDRYMTVGTNVAPLIAGMTDLREIRLRIDDEQRKAFEDVERQVLDAISARTPA